MRGHFATEQFFKQRTMSAIIVRSRRKQGANVTDLP